MNKLLLATMLISSMSFAGVQGEVGENRARDSFTYGSICISGYLFAYANKGGERGSISLQQIFKDGYSVSKPNDPIECK